MQPSQWINPGAALDVSLLFTIDGRKVMRRIHWRHREAKALPAETWKDAKSAGLVPIEDYSPPLDAPPVMVGADEHEPAPAPEQPIGREWINTGPTRALAFTTIRIGKTDVDRAVRWYHGDVKHIPEAWEPAARRFGLVPLDEHRDEPHERWKHTGKGTRVTVGDLVVPYWVPGDAKLLPVSKHKDAEAAGLVFLGAAL
jgi:hypothetical protein